MADELTMKQVAWNATVDLRLKAATCENMREAYQLGYDTGAKEAAMEIRKQLVDKLAKRGIHL